MRSSKTYMMIFHSIPIVPIDSAKDIEPSLITNCIDIRSINSSNDEILQFAGSRHVVATKVHIEQVPYVVIHDMDFLNHRPNFAVANADHTVNIAGPIVIVKKIVGGKIVKGLTNYDLKRIKENIYVSVQNIKNHHQKQAYPFIMID